MKRHINATPIIYNSKMLFFATVGGTIFSFTGLSVGWLVGALVATGIWQLFTKADHESARLSPLWKNAAQVIIALQVSKHISGAAMHSFATGWPAIAGMLALTLMFSLLFGFVFSKLSGTDLKTSLFALTPGGISSIPTISEDSGANPAVVSSVHVLRIAVVSSMVPLLASMCAHAGLSPLAVNYPSPLIIEPFYETTLYESVEFMHGHPVVWTVVLSLSVWAGVLAAKKMKFPAAVLVGGILGVTFTQLAVSSYANFSIVPWLPQWVKVAAQIMLGASLGAKINRSMFIGAGRALLVGLFSVTGLLALMIGCSFLLNFVTGIPFLTSLLSFAPGGVAEMAATSNAIQADSSFVIAAQTLRLILIYTLLPFLINGITRLKERKKTV